MKDDRLRYPRLKLRPEDYREITPKLYCKIDSHKHEEYWRPACELLPQLSERYEGALGEKMDQAIANLRANEACRG